MLGSSRVWFGSGSDTLFEFYIDNAMRGGVGGVDREICKAVFCSNVAVQRCFQMGRRECSAHTQSQRAAPKRGS